MSNLKLKGLQVAEPMIKKQISLRESDHETFEQYMEFLKKETGVDHSQSEVASLMIVNWMQKDASFKKWLKSLSKPEQPMETKERAEELEDGFSSGGSW